MLNELDRADLLKPDSKFQDLSLVMGMALKWSDGQIDYGYDEEHPEWRNSVVAYANKGGIDLAASPLHEAPELVDGVDDAEVAGKAKVDRWDWKKRVGPTLTILVLHTRTQTNASPSSRTSKQEMARKRGPMKAKIGWHWIRHHEDEQRRES
jgi:hypothetical protein